MWLQHQAPVAFKLENERVQRLLLFNEQRASDCQSLPLHCSLEHHTVQGTGEADSGSQTLSERLSQLLSGHQGGSRH